MSSGEAECKLKQQEVDEAELYNIMQDNFH